MAQPQLVADEVTTVAMIRAFDTTQDECQAIQNAVDSAAILLAQGWSGLAANKYRDAINQWQQGFNKVRQGLNLLNESMAGYANITKTTEDNNLMIGSSWAQGLTEPTTQTQTQSR
ncbi:WXG100 family type VII secretion target [Frankia sp. EI5c]|uniref:WXG100 family type VII secretion target n=1 Tax=Frankia sp. EI5c TaxID=683316 RepID=UPI0007C3D6A0|nr:WXG100 family type VII secretion target [Frankia sp. EI5c]OAA29202.1 WXG100 family type VII secretion target [Frankia sp. EI5c]